jgi:hypothetical protein
MILACCGQSMCDAVVTCQNPPGYPSSRIAVTACTWVCPFTGRAARAVSSPASQPSCAASIEPCQPPCGFTVSSMRHRTMPWSKP